MESNVYSNLQPNMLGLEMSLHHNLPPPNPQNPHQISHHHPMAAAFAPHDGADFRHHHHHHHQTHQTSKPTHPKSKNQTLTLSDDDEPGGGENGGEDGKRKTSPWQRMKWTDNMVRLLIMVVFYIGDEVGSEAGDAGKKKGGGGGGGGGMLQKKGKWKSVSRAMMERGFYVSPQQCEDKFNDLNKRYKRVNDILGKGTSCRVVENQTLLESMDLSPKLKEEVKKLLNSKHLFFREMCAYHNSCGNNGGGGGVQQSPEAEAPPERCLHSSEMMAAKNNNQGCKQKGMSHEEDEDEYDDEEEEEEDEEDEDEMPVSHKRRKSSPLINQLDGEIMSVMRDGGKTAEEKRQWVRSRMVGLEERRVEIQTQSFELEKQRLKWLKFSSKKEREMEREKLVNERVKLVNERLVLFLRQKELDLIDLQQQSSKKSDPSSVTG